MRKLLNGLLVTLFVTGLGFITCCTPAVKPDEKLQPTLPKTQVAEVKSNFPPMKVQFHPREQLNEDKVFACLFVANTNELLCIDFDRYMLEMVK